ncbi:hypothetical protein Taro_014179, partial [Colocasia esculenta]|nr:hypothetical protein [Colocasia esculenta]
MADAAAVALPCGQAEEGARSQQETPPPPTADLAPPPPSPMEAWESGARSWLSSLPGSRCPASADMDAWLDSAQPPLPEELTPLSRPRLHQQIVSVHNSLFGGSRQVQPPTPSGGAEGSGGDDGDRADGPRGRFQRAEHWNPVYSWLESLDTDEVVSANDVKDWFLANPEIKENLSRNSRFHCDPPHHNVPDFTRHRYLDLKSSEDNLPNDIGDATDAEQSVQMCKTRTALRILSNGLRARSQIPRKFSSRIPKGKDLTLLKKNEAFLRYELLTDLQNQLVSVLSKSIHVDNLIKAYSPGLRTLSRAEHVTDCSVGKEEKQNLSAVSIGESPSHSVDMVENFLIARKSELSVGLKRKRNASVAASAWSYCEASFGNFSFPLGTIFKHLRFYVENRWDHNGTGARMFNTCQAVIGAHLEYSHQSVLELLQTLLSQSPLLSLSKGTAEEERKEVEGGGDEAFSVGLRGREGVFAAWLLAQP